jgi:UDPglucose 6-dehydrogenase
MGTGETRMKVAIVGLWHLGIVTAACLAKAGHEVIGYDPDKTIIENLQQNIAPIFEPGLDDLLKTHSLSYSSQPDIIHSADIVWINFDTPVDENDIADIMYVKNEIEKLASHIKNNSLLLISSQLPVGTTRKIQQQISQQYPEKNIRFGYIPENLRLGKAINVFTHADRFVVGLDHQEDQEIVKSLLGKFTEHFVWMSIESAEMTKHALNAFLAVSVTFINEIATLCESVGANASEVEAGLKSEERIGPKAYLRAGGAIAGGTLMRDINYLNQIGTQLKHPVPLLSSVLQSNAYHKDWVHRKIHDLLQELKNKTVAVLGLTYKANTNTLRRSSSVETCQWLSQHGVIVNAFDPAIQNLPNDCAEYINLKTNIEDALHTADAVVVATEWPDFRKLAANTLLDIVKQPVVLDPNGFLMATLGQNPHVRYYSVGR